MEIINLHSGLVGGTRLVREGIVRLLADKGFEVNTHFSEGPDFDSKIEQQLESLDILFVILSGSSNPFELLHKIQHLIGKPDPRPGLAILSDDINRGQVYASVSMEAGAIMDMECSSDDLESAVRMVLDGKRYLSPEVTQLLVGDMSTALDKDGSRRLPLADLSRREVEIVQLLCEGLSSKEVARQLHLSAKTVENHRYNIYKKCNVESVVSLMRYAVQHGMVTI